MAKKLFMILLAWGIAAALPGCGGALITTYEGADDAAETVPDGADGEGDAAREDTVVPDPLPEDVTPAEDAPPEVPVDPQPDEAPPDIEPDVIPDGPCPLQQIPFQAEAMTLDSGFLVETSSRPEIGQYIMAQGANTGSASIALDIPCAGNWVMWGIVWWQDSYSDSFFWAWDDPATRYVWHVMQQCGTSIPQDWYWDQVSRSPVTTTCVTIDEDPAVMPLTAGPHTFYLLGREPGASAAEFVLTNDMSWTPS